MVNDSIEGRRLTSIPPTAEAACAGNAPAIFTIGGRRALPHQQRQRGRCVANIAAGSAAPPREASVVRVPRLGIIDWPRVLARRVRIALFLIVTIALLIRWGLAKTKVKANGRAGDHRDRADSADSDPQLALGDREEGRGRRRSIGVPIGPLGRC